MKQLALLLLVIGLGSGARIRRDEPEPVVDLKSESINYGNGTFTAIVERSDGSKIYQAGYIRNPEEPDPEKRVQVLLGSYTHVEDGVEYNVNYLADDTGYHVDGDHIRGASPLPEYVYRVVDNVRSGRGGPIGENV